MFVHRLLSSFILVLALMPLAAACGSCPEGMTKYQDSCADPQTLNFISCTSAGSASLTTEQKAKVSAEVGTALKLAGSKGAVEVVNTVTRNNFESGATAVIAACIDRLKNATDTPASMKPGLALAQQQFEAQVTAACTGPEGQTPSMAINPDRGKLPIQLVVTGRNWPPNQQLEITGFAGPLDRANADATGRFTKTVTLQTLAGGGPPTITVRVAPVDLLVRSRCPQMSQTALFHTQ